MLFLMREGFTKPTEIQAQARPIDLQSNGLDDIAETGCGKSITYVLPMLISIQAPSGKLSLTRKPSAMKTLLFLLHAKVMAGDNREGTLLKIKLQL